MCVCVESEGVCVWKVRVCVCVCSVWVCDVCCTNNPLTRI